MAIDFLENISPRQKQWAIQLAANSRPVLGNETISVSDSGEVWLKKTLGPKGVFQTEPILIGKYSGATGAYESLSN